MSENIPRKSTSAAYLWWLALGAVGGHKFYLGRPKAGMLYLLTFGLFGFGCLADLFTLPLQVRNANLRRPSDDASSRSRRSALRVRSSDDEPDESSVFAHIDFEKYRTPMPAPTSASKAVTFGRRT